jgi:RNase P protein component
VRLANDTMQTGHDYVLIGRRVALNAPFERMSDEFTRALKRAHRK